MMNTVPQAVVMGASAGALEALSQVLPALPADYPLPVMLVVHVPPGRDSLLADLLRNKCRMAVQEAEDKVLLEPGTLYVAPPDYHLLVEHDGRLSLSSDEPVLFSRPSIDVLFETAADAYRDRVIGVVLTGANADGARGLQAIAEAGGTVLVQEPDGAYADTMPRAALHACPTAHRLRLAEIASYLQEAVSA